MDWERQFEAPNVSCHGHTGKDSVHVKRFVRRCDISWACTMAWRCRSRTRFQTQRRRRTASCAKHYMMSKAISQAPLRFLPASRVKWLSTFPAQVKERNWMSEDILRRYEATAAAILKPPWHMEEASAYLREWCQKNRDRVCPNPPALHFIFGTDRTVAPAPAVNWVDFAPDRPLLVQVFPRLPRRARVRAAVEALLHDIE